MVWDRVHIVVVLGLLLSQHVDAQGWTTITPIPVAILQSCVVFRGDTFHVLGGRTGPGNPGQRLHLSYNIVTGDWTSRVLPPAGCYQAACGYSFSSELIFLIAGKSSVPTGINTNQQYNVATDAWTNKPSHPKSAPQVGGVWVDYFYTFGEGGTHKQYWGLAMDNWTTLNMCPSGRTEGVGAAQVGASFFLVGATPTTDATILEKYDVDTDTWTTKTPRPSNELWLSSHFCALGTFAYAGHRDNNVFEAYDSLLDTWASLAAFPMMRSQTAMGCGNQLVVAFAGAPAPSAPAGDGQSHAYQVGASVFGDPHFTAFDGVRYYVEVKPDSVYNLFTSSTLSVNAAFRHTPYLPPSHDVTIKEVGIWILDGNVDVKLSALDSGKIFCSSAPETRIQTEKGFEFVFGTVKVEADITEGGGLTVRTNDVVIVVQPVNMALLFDTQIGTVSVSPTRWIDVNFFPVSRTPNLAHGLVGQSLHSRRTRVPALVESSTPFEDNILEGSLQSYEVMGGGVFDLDFAFNLLDTRKRQHAIEL